MAAQYDPRRNGILSALSPAEQERVFPHLELVPLRLGEVLYHCGETQRWAYFPVDCLVSLMNVLQDGHSVELSVVGKEGLVGIALFMGGGSVLCRSEVQCGGCAYRVAGQVLKQEFADNDELRRLLLRYTQSLISEIGQTAVCNRRHSITQQLSRWLLLALDRSPSVQLTITHERIANMLGVRRESVSVAVGALVALGAIACARGKLTIRDRSCLERQSCEC